MEQQLTMWTAISNVLTSRNVNIVLLFILFVIILVGILSHTGLLKIHTNTFELGIADRERNIIRQQTEWIKLHLDSMVSSMPKPQDYDEWRAKYISNAVYSEYINWITLNHLLTTRPYIEIKQDRIVALVRSLTYKQEFHSDEFERFLRDDTKYNIEKLVQIRAVYK